jgi:hypothetical protein
MDIDDILVVSHGTTFHNRHMSKNKPTEIHKFFSELE